MAITHKLDPRPALQYLGNKTCIRGLTSYNNFCLYNPEASPIHHDYTKNSKECVNLTGALWAKLNKEEKASNGMQLGPKLFRKQHVNLKPKRWAKKTLLDLKRLGEAYQVEGFMVLVTRRGKRVVVTAGGSHLGQQYIDMTELEEDNSGPVQDFFKFVNGQSVVKKLIKKLTGSAIPALTKPRKERKERVILADGKYDKGTKKANLSDVREKLGTALAAATGGCYTQGWPGDTAAKLKELGVQLRVQANDMNVTPDFLCGRLANKWDIDLQHLQVAMGKGWMKLKGPESTANNTVDVIGAVPDSKNNTASNSNDTVAPNPDKNTGLNPANNNNNVTDITKRGVKRSGGKIDQGKSSKRSRTAKGRKLVDPLEEEDEEEESEEENSSDNYDDDTSNDDTSKEDSNNEDQSDDEYDNDSDM
ncbi:hypothetical protein PCANC_24001 [Puccinia coronata f. sp. avenae]|uniref:Uncharacterized protein n=1 Tax=Puccinia coronata f. sp. avenae TaxID=200324 RepID=A0A2N5TSB5_9BASI|nr:hypothetical protein PCANC_24001 [Puccinia coronata f. sp. avenae]